MEAGISDRVWGVEEIIGLLDGRPAGTEEGSVNLHKINKRLNSMNLARSVFLIMVTCAYGGFFCESAAKTPEFLSVEEEKSSFELRFVATDVLSKFHVNAAEIGNCWAAKALKFPPPSSEKSSKIITGGPLLSTEIKEMSAEGRSNATPENRKDWDEVHAVLWANRVAGW